ncbi:MAG TPA: DUF47 family protein [Candidatus Sulfotelmatobacter sp.]|jgi:predicted phosphate transport protein (TIGR00153 family)|nr:DUF47 family protein [Candidatus Sulfotelmatobacter sp.]
MLSRLLRSLMPKEERFLDQFQAHAGCILTAAEALQTLMSAPAADRPARVADLKRIEKEADQIGRQTVIGLHRAFITPFDRSDILALSNALDDAVDLIEEVAILAELYQLAEFDGFMTQLSGHILRCAQKVCQLIPLLEDISRNAGQINGLCESISSVEGEADDALRAALQQLVADRPETIAFFARKEVYELLEAVTDRCDDVADVIEGIMLDHV